MSIEVNGYGNTIVVRAGVNSVVLEGYVVRVRRGDRYAFFRVAIPRQSASGMVSYSYVDCVAFGDLIPLVPDAGSGSWVRLEGRMEESRSQDGKIRVRVVVQGLEKF